MEVGSNMDFIKTKEYLLFGHLQILEKDACFGNGMDNLFEKLSLCI